MDILIIICGVLAFAIIVVNLLNFVFCKRKKWVEEIQLFDKLIDKNWVKNRWDDEAPYVRTPVPKIIWRIWCEPGPFGTCGGRNAQKNPWTQTKLLAPEWEQRIFEDGENWSLARRWLETEFGYDHEVTQAFNLLNNEYGAAKADLLRYAIIYINGGIYLDMKSCISKKIPEMPPDKDMITFQWNTIFAPQSHLFTQGGEYVNWFLYARPKAPIMKEILRTTAKNVLDLHKNPYKALQLNISQEVESPTKVHPKGLVLAVTGPIMLTKVIKNSKYSNTVHVINNPIKVNMLNAPELTDVQGHTPIATYMCQSDLSTGKKHYSNAKGPLVFPAENALYIPNILYTTHEKSSDFTTDLLTLQKCEEFIKTYYPNFVEDWMLLEDENKLYSASIAMLYVYGGNIGNWQTKPNLHVPNTWYVNFTNFAISTPPRNPVLLAYIKDMISNGWVPSTDFKFYVEKSCENPPLRNGKNLMLNGWFVTVIDDKAPKNFHIYVINLKRSEGRRNHMISQLKNCPIPWTIISAVDGKEKLPDNSIPINGLRQLKPGEIGVFLSHLKVWDSFLNNSHATTAIVMEDDCELPDNWWQHITKTSDEYMPNVCNFMHLDKKLYNFYDIIGKDVEGFFPEKFNHRLREIPNIYPEVSCGDPELGLVCYAIDKHGAQVLLDNLKTILCPIDVQIHFPEIRKQLKWGKLRNNVIDHGNFASVVQ